MGLIDRAFRGLGYIPRRTIHPMQLQVTSSLQKVIDTEPSETMFARKPFSKLEQLYYTDSVIFNGVNFYVRKTLASGYFVDTESEQEPKRTCEKLLRKAEFDQKVEKIVNHMGVFGNGFLEVVSNKAHDNIIDLFVTDPKFMDFKKDMRNKNQIVTDAFGNPTTYLWRSPFSAQPVEIDATKIAHFKLYNLGASMMGLGFVEPMFKTSVIKLNIEEALGQTSFRHGFPLGVVKVGDKDRFPSPTPEDINAAHDSIKNLNYKADLAIPWYWNFELIKPHTDEVVKLKETLNYFIQQQASAFGLPIAYLTGSGEKTNRSVLEFQANEIEPTINMIQSRISSVMREKVFKPLVEMNHGPDAEVPELKWEPINPEDITAKINNIISLMNSGLLEPDETLRRHIKHMLDLPITQRREETLRKK